MTSGGNMRTEVWRYGEKLGELEEDFTAGG